MNGKSVFIDLTRCEACGKCQLACRQWKKLPASGEEPSVSPDGAADLDENTLKRVLIARAVVDGEPHWLFFPEQCRHCLIPQCKIAADAQVKGAIVRDDETGTVLFTEKTRYLDYRSIRMACRYDIPRQNPRTGVLVKCNMCIDRLRHGMEPACVAICPSGAMRFGNRRHMLDLAYERLARIRRQYPAAILADSEEVRIIYLYVHNPAYLHTFITNGRLHVGKSSDGRLLIGPSFMKWEM